MVTAREPYLMSPEISEFVVLRNPWVLALEMSTLRHLSRGGRHMSTLSYICGAGEGGRDNGPRMENLERCICPLLGLHNYTQYIELKTMLHWWHGTLLTTYGPRQANLVLIAYASSEGSGEPAHPRSLARTSAARSYKQWIKRNLQTESQTPGPSEWLDMRS